jgi:Spy/CpxP family protein refolding chaperone
VNPNRKPVLWLLIVFALGLVLGVLASELAGGWGIFGGRGRRGDWRQHAVERFTRELSLSAEQRQQLETILDETKKKYQGISETTRPQYEAARQEGREKIRVILTPEQKVKFEELIREIDREHAERRR